MSRAQLLGQSIASIAALSSINLKLRRQIMTVLVIEDDELIRSSLINILLLRGISAIAAADGRTGLQLAKEVIPDLILCDVRMPEMNGYDVLRALRQDSTVATIPLIFLTAETNQDLIERGQLLEADGYLNKPFTTAQLLRAIAPYLR